MPRLPAISENPWGEVLNDFLAVGHGPAGEHRFDCPTLNELRALNVAHGSQAIVSGYGNAGDGGGGQFYYDENSSLTDDDGTIITPSSGSGRWLRLHNEFRPEFFGAVGDGVEDDAAAVQACVDAAELVAGSTVLLKPKVTYAVASSIIIGAGAYSIRVEGRAFTNFPGATTPFTFTKAANVPAIVVPTGSSVRPFLSSISVKGLGDPDPSLTDTDVDGTPGILIQSRCNGDKLVFFQTGGMSGYGEEGETIGSALCILQREGAENVNGCTFTNIVAVNCRGGVYVGKVSSGVTNGKNMQAVRVECNRVYNCIGYGVNGDGGRNRYIIQNFYGPASTAQFRMRGDDSVAIADYAEQNTPVGCDFQGGARNIFVAADSSKYTVVYSNLGNNTVDCPNRRIVTVGTATGGYLPSVSGSAGVQFDTLSLPNPLASAYVKVKEAAYLDVSSIIKILAGTTEVTDHTSKVYVAKIAKVGVNCTLVLSLTGVVVTPSSSNFVIELPKASTGIAFDAEAKTPVGPVLVTNSSGTTMYWARISTDERVTLINSSGVQQSYNTICGSVTAFEIRGTLTIMDTAGMV